MSQLRALPSWLKHLVIMLALASLYVVTARLGLTLALPPEGKATAVWPPSGIALAAVLLLGYRVWPGIWLGAFLSNLWDFFGPTNEFPLAAHLLVSSGIAVGSTLQPLLGAYLLRRWIGEQSPLRQARSVFQFVGVALVMCLVASTVGVTTLYLAGFASWDSYGFNWWTWWLGDTVGIFVVTPLVLAWSKPPRFAWEPQRLAEAGFMLGLLLGVGLWVFGGWNPLGIDTSFLVYMTIPPLVWAAFRFGQHGATATLLLMSGIAVWGTAQNHGPFVLETLNESLIFLQTFMAVLMVTALALAGVVTERQRAHVALAQSEQRLTMALQAARMVAWEWDPVRNEIVTTDNFAEIYGLPEIRRAEEGFALVHPDDHARHQALVQEAVRSGGAYHSEFRIIRPDTRRTVWLEEWGLVIQNDDGGLEKLVGVVKDITERKGVDEIRDSIISMVSHELRTPIHHVRGYASSLLQTDVQWDEQARMEFIRNIDKEADRLGRLVSNILNMSRLGAGEFSVLKLVSIHPKDLVRSSLEDALLSLQEHELSVDVPEALPQVMADPERIKLVLTNLLDNAAKYSPAGSRIRLTAHHEEGEVVFSFEDEGAGISEEERGRLFERFTRLYQSGASRVPGTGLGLAICRMIVSSHKGRIWVESRIGGGSTFSFSLPVTPGL